MGGRLPTGTASGSPRENAPLPQNSQHVLTMLGASAAARHCFPSPAEATPVTSLLGRGQRTEGAHEEPRCHNAGPPRNRPPQPRASGHSGWWSAAWERLRVLPHRSPQPPSLSMCPCQARRLVPEQRKSETNSCPQASLLSRGNGSINNFFSPKVG